MPKKITHDDFMDKILEKHGDLFDYTKTRYINYRTKITITCKSHGEFEIFPDNHLRGQGCVMCARERHKLTKIDEDRLAILRDVHAGKYEYKDLTVTDGKINITCHKHGDFTQSIHQHEYGHGCPQCGIDIQKRPKSKVCRTCKRNLTLDNYGPRYKHCKDCVEKRITFTEKSCSGCGVTKPLSDFPERKDSMTGVRNLCKNCIVSYRKPINQKYRKNNRARINEYGKAYHKARLATDDLYRAKVTARDVVRKAIAKMGYRKGSRTEEILGCSYSDFKAHMESMFREGMGWHNRGEWHVDHVVPLSSGRTESEVLALNRYTNLQPLWGLENMSKSDRMPNQAAGQ
jgi:hypothetical protein